MMSWVWIELIRGLEPGAEFQPPATDQAIFACEQALATRLDPDLAALLREANGVHGSYGLGLVWPAERIAADNIAFRTSPDFAELYMPFEPLLFFADAGQRRPVRVRAPRSAQGRLRLGS